MSPDRLRLRLSTAFACLVSLALFVAPPALGATIPKGDYVCSSSTLGYAGTVNIKANNKYSVNDGKKGKYAFSRKRKIITFKTGDYESFFGEYSKQSKGFDVFSKKTGDYGWSCYRD